MEIDIKKLKLGITKLFSYLVFFSIFIAINKWSYQYDTNIDGLYLATKVGSPHRVFLFLDAWLSVTAQTLFLSSASK